MFILLVPSKLPQYEIVDEELRFWSIEEEEVVWGLDDELISFLFWDGEWEEMLEEDWLREEDDGIVSGGRRGWVDPKNGSYGGLRDGRDDMVDEVWDGWFDHK